METQILEKKPLKREIIRDNLNIKIEPKHCKGFVDDIFVLFEKLQHLQEFAEYINKQILSGRFSTETGKKGALSFLGITTCREDGTFATNGQRKDTFSGVYKTFTSFVSLEYKCSLLYVFFIGIFDSYWIFQSLK